jgi:hypothetical protein
LKDKGMYDALNYFVESINLQEHPLAKAKEKIKIEYFTTLSYIIHISDNH